MIRVTPAPHRSTPIVEDGPYRQAPLVVTAALIGLAAVAFAILSPNLGPAPVEAREAAPVSAPPAAEALPRDGMDKELADQGLASQLLRDLRAQEKTMSEARDLLPASNFGPIFESDLASVRKQIVAEERRLAELRANGYTPEVVCGDNPC